MKSYKSLVFVNIDVVFYHFIFSLGSDKMFQITSREPVEPINEEAGVLSDLEDVLESEKTQDTADQTEEDKGDNPEHSASPVQPVVPDLLLD